MKEMTRRFALKGLVLSAFLISPFCLAPAWADADDHGREMRKKREEVERERRKDAQERAREREENEREKRLKREEEEREKAQKQFEREREERKRLMEEEKDGRRREREDARGQQGMERAWEAREQKKGRGLGKDAPGRKHSRKIRGQKERGKSANRRGK